MEVLCDVPSRGKAWPTASVEKILAEWVDLGECYLSWLKNARSQKKSVDLRLLSEGKKKLTLGGHECKLNLFWWPFLCTYKVNRFYTWNKQDVTCQSHLSRVHLCDPINCSPRGSTVQGILQAGILEWLAMPSSRGSYWTRDRTWVFCVSCISRRVLYYYHRLGSLPCYIL